MFMQLQNLVQFWILVHYTQLFLQVYTYKLYIYIYIPKKAQEQDGFGNKIKYHFHITTVHKYI